MFAAKFDSSQAVGEQQGHWLTSGRFAVLLALLICAAFPDVVLGGKVFQFRDYTLFSYPLAHYHRECFWRGEIPLWNPHNNLGIPFLAQWNTLTLYPLSLIYLFFPLPWSLGLFNLFHLFLGGWGMYWLAHRWSGNRLGAALAGIAYPFSGVSLSCLIWTNYTATLGWTPWVILLVERGWRQGGRALIIATLVGGLQMLSGTPEPILFTWLLLAAMWLGQLWRERASRPRYLLRFPAIVALVVALTAVQLLPFLELLKHSQRQSSFGGTSWAMSPCGWANFFVPMFQLAPTRMGVYVQWEQGVFSSYYLGIVPLALAVLSAWCVRRRIVWLLGSILLLSLILSLGTEGHVYAWILNAVPSLGFMRYPVKFVIFAAYAVPLLAALALGNCLPPAYNGRSMEPRSVWVVATALLFAMAAIVWFSVCFPGPSESSRLTVISGTTRGLFLVLGMAVFVATARSRRALFQTISQIGLLLIVWGDLITHVPRQNPTVSADAFRMDLPPLEQMSPFPRHGESRAMLTWNTVVQLNETIVSNALDSVVGLRLGLCDNANLLQEIPKVDGFYALFLAKEQAFRSRFYRSDPAACQPLFDFLGVSQLSSEEQFLRWNARTNAMPLITAGQKPIFTDSATAMREMTNTSFSPRQFVYLPAEAAKRVRASNATIARILRQTVSAHRFRFEIDAPAPTLAVIAQVHYAPWRAYVNGRPAKIWPANYAFQAVEIPAGRSEVHLVYRDSAFAVGAVLSTITALGCACAWCGRRRTRDCEVLQPAIAA